MEDLRFDEHVPEDLADMVDDASATFDASTAARFLELIRLTQTLHTLLETALYDPTLHFTLSCLR